MHATLRAAIALSLCIASYCATSLCPSDAQAQGVRRERPWLGFIADKSQPDAVIIARVLRGSPAQQAGLRPGDTILKAQGKPLTSTRSLKLVVRALSAGDKLDLIVKRPGQATVIPITLNLVPLPSTTAMASTQLLGRPAPSITFQTVDKQGETTRKTLEDLRGKPTVILFWATWCTPCLPFKQKLDQLATDRTDRRLDINIIAMSTEPAPTLAMYLQNHTHPYIIAHDPGDYAHTHYFAKMLPTVVILDEDAIVRKVFDGKQSPEFLEQALRALN